jgi:hypothetical protein
MPPAPAPSLALPPAAIALLLISSLLVVVMMVIALVFALRVWALLLSSIARASYGNHRQRHRRCSNPFHERPDVGVANCHPAGSERIGVGWGIGRD